MANSGVIYHIIRFLQQEATSATISESQRESVEVAAECLADAYEIAADDADSAADLALDPAQFLDALKAAGVFTAPTAPTPKPVSSEADMPPSFASPEEADKEADKRKAEADAHKQRGNRHIKDREWALAVEAYTEAISICPDNAVYYGNRAAAFSGMECDDEAIKDCERSLQINPKYVKAHSRMGNALLNKGDYEGAAACYEAALNLDPSNQTYAEQLALAERRRDEEHANNSKDKAGAVGAEKEADNEADVSANMPDLSKMNIDNMPDLSQVNLNEVMNSVMSNPDMMRVAQGMMGNPQMMNMAQSVLGQMSGSSIQDMVAQLSNPEAQNGNGNRK